MSRRICHGLVGTGSAAAAVAPHNLLQKRHAVLRNWDGRPFDRDTRSIIYERAKGIHGERAFGTKLYEWLPQLAEYR